MDGVIQRHFGSDALWHRAEILRRLERIRGELDRQSSHRHLCRIALSARNHIGVDLLPRLDSRLFCRFNMLATGRVGGNVATLCVDADGNPEGGWETLLHEMVHLVGIGNLPARENATPAQVAAGAHGRADLDTARQQPPDDRRCPHPLAAPDQRRGDHASASHRAYYTTP